MLAVILSMIKNEPGIKVLYLLIPGFYPLFVWLRRDLKARAVLGPSTDAASSVLSRVELLSVTIACSVGAGVIHIAALRGHAMLGWQYQTFFTTTALFQLAWPFWLFRDASRRALLAGAVVNAAIVLTWFVSRTTGLPFGESPGVAEQIGFADTLCSLFEVVLVAVCVMLLQTRSDSSAETLVTGRLRAPIACISICALALIAFATGAH